MELTLEAKNKYNRGIAATSYLYIELFVIRAGG